MDETWRFKAHELIRQTFAADHLGKSMGGEIDLHIDIGYPSVINNGALTSAMAKTKEFASDENVSETEMRMGTEDLVIMHRPFLPVLPAGNNEYRKALHQECTLLLLILMKPP